MTAGKVHRRFIRSPAGRAQGPVRLLIRDATRAAPVADLGIEIVQGNLCDPAAA
jgi:hypothetical protein